ncbi:hypothetical protein CCACVL1_17835, partial [Corchorus capsularis]
KKFDLRGVNDVWILAYTAKKWRDHKIKLKTEYFNIDLTPNMVKGKFPEEKPGMSIEQEGRETGRAT